MRLLPYQFIASIIVLLLSNAVIAESKIGYVNINRLLQSAPAAQRAEEKLRQEFANRDVELSRLRARVTQAQADLEKDGITLSEQQLRARERDLSALDGEFQRKQEQFKEDLEARRKDELGNLLEGANRAVRKIGEAGKYDIIFQEAVWASPAIDVTESVIKAMEATDERTTSDLK